MSLNNLFEGIPEVVGEELFDEIVNSAGVRVERILSQGQTSPASGWYDQDENEWVVILQGAGKIAFEDGSEVLLSRGDYLNIPKHTKHRVAWAEPDAVTVWLAVFYP
ncbi:MAG: cupin domain-containing protein [Gammaproteobacteria bacterium]|nr:cupin domain-containing protein [Gammaproteobacteria bacterium]